MSRPSGHSLGQRGQGPLAVSLSSQPCSDKDTSQMGMGWQHGVGVGKKTQMPG